MPTRTTLLLVALAASACTPLGVRAVDERPGAEPEVQPAPEVGVAEPTASPIDDEPPLFELGGPLEESVDEAPAPEVAVAEPPPIPTHEAEVAQVEPESEATAGVPIDASAPTHAEPRRARTVRANELIGALVSDPATGPVGVVDDALLDGANGEVVGVLVRLAGRDGGYSICPPTALRRRSGDKGFELVPQEHDGVELAQHVGYSMLFDGQRPASIEGDITDIEPIRTALDPAVMLKVRDSNNLLHRARVDAVHLVERVLPNLSVGQKIRLEGVSTRDEKAKLWIISSIARGPTSLRLRTSSGALAWDELRAPFVSVQGFGSPSLEAAGGEEFAVHGIRIDLEEGRASIAVVVDGVERSLSWRGVGREGAAWKVTLDATSFGALPEVEDGSDRDG